MPDKPFWDVLRLYTISYHISREIVASFQTRDQLQAMNFGDNLIDLRWKNKSLHAIIY